MTSLVISGLGVITRAANDPASLWSYLLTGNHISGDSVETSNGGRAFDLSYHLSKTRPPIMPSKPMIAMPRVYQIAINGIPDSGQCSE